MMEPDNLRYTKFPLGNGAGAIPALGFGTLIPDPIATKNAAKAALIFSGTGISTAIGSAGFRGTDSDRMG
jgi:hypothetical protein